jgi:hypothetical protein
MASTLQGDDEDYLVRCVRLALEQQANGEPVDTTALCRERPHLQRALDEALGLADQLPVLQRDLQEVDPLAGLLLAGRYRLRACLGRGAMGVVYRADDQELRRQVAVKILDARLFADPQAVQRFQREAEILAGLRHAAVVAVHDRGRTPEGIAFLVMELLEGVSLAALIDRIARAEQEGRDGRAQPDTNAVFTACGIAPAPAGLWRQAAQWGAAIADALSAAHEAGVVHRDIKPSNVFVRRDGTVVLLDFGIAARGDGARLTATTTTLGTPWYMAPEQVAAGGFEPTSAQDIYGLGATVWHLLAGRPPYEGSAPAVMAALPHRDPPPLRTVRAELPRDLAAIVERAMERDPRRRFATAALLAADFRAFLEHRPVSARPLSALQRRWRAVRRAPAKALGGLAAILAVVLLAAVLPLQQRQQPRSTRSSRRWCATGCSMPCGSTRPGAAMRGGRWRNRLPASPPRQTAVTRPRRWRRRWPSGPPSCATRWGNCPSGIADSSNCGCSKTRASRRSLPPSATPATRRPGRRSGKHKRSCWSSCASAASARRTDAGRPRCRPAPGAWPIARRP